MHFHVNLGGEYRGTHQTLEAIASVRLHGAPKVANHIGQSSGALSIAQRAQRFPPHLLGLGSRTRSSARSSNTARCPPLKVWALCLQFLCCLVRHSQAGATAIFICSRYPATGMSKGPTGTCFETACASVVTTTRLNLDALRQGAAKL